MIIEDLNLTATPTISALDVAYPVMEHFHTLQGEGAHTGRSAYFIRLAGCDVGCSWCDVKDSWDAKKHPKIAVGDLVEAAVASKAPFVVITGGEPLLHDLTALTHALHNAGLVIHLETSGSSPMSGSFDWVTLSPKRFKAPVDSVYQHVNELKVVVVNKKDFDWAEMHAERCPEGTVLLLQPEWDSPKTMPWITDYVMQHPKWGVSLQTHKFLGIP
jgi:7-carboxy-7-deazaguanine synthase